MRSKWNFLFQGEAHVFMCKRFDNDKVAIQRFINPMNHSHPVPAASEQGGVFTPLPSQFIDGIVTCKFALSDFPPETREQPNALRPLSQSGNYHPIFAVGLLNATGMSFLKKYLEKGRGRLRLEIGPLLKVLGNDLPPSIPTR